MRSFLITIEGRNIYLENTETHHIERLGFFATRIIKAKDEIKAIYQGLDLIGREIKELIIPIEDEKRQPIFSVSEIHETSDDLEEKKGFSFYRDPI